MGIRGNGVMTGVARTAEIDKQRPEQGIVGLTMSFFQQFPWWVRAGVLGLAASLILKTVGITGMVLSATAFVVGYGVGGGVPILGLRSARYLPAPSSSPTIVESPPVKEEGGALSGMLM